MQNRIQIIVAILSVSIANWLRVTLNDVSIKILGSFQVKSFHFFSKYTINMSELESSAQETVTDTWTSQMWNATKVLKSTDKRNIMLKSLFIEIETENKKWTEIFFL